MGKLVRHSAWFYARQVTLRWVLPLVISVGLVFGVSSLVRADTPPSSSELADYLKTNQLALGVDSVNGYQQIYYRYNGRNIFITGSNYNHVNPVSSGEFIAWQGLELDGTSQIYVYDILTGALTQLTSEGINQNPAITGSMVMWQHWTGEHWQLLYNTGLENLELTTGEHSAVRPVSDGKQILFSQQADDGSWQAYSFDLTTQQYTVVASGDEKSTAFPHFAKNGNVTTGIKALFKD